MTLLAEWSTALQDVLSTFLGKASHFLPKLVGALVLLLVGWLVARVLRTIGTQLVATAERVLSQSSIARNGSSVRLPMVSARVLGSILFWLVMLFFVTAATEVLGLALFTAWLGQLVAYVPTMAAGALIIVVGVLVSRMARQLVEAAPIADDPAQRVMLGRMVQAAILITAVLVGADQIGIRVTFIVVMAVVVIAALVGAAALSVSLGSRSYVANLIGSHYLRQTYSIGQQVRVEGFEGKILEMSNTSLVLETTDGRVSLPARLFNEAPIVLLIERPDGSLDTHPEARNG
ncbi:mechanosensitive ion channel domain-containing protein [uncultured Nevskia sp.]|uniref:mechanosensitive ion channel family protein n=1 Tax=uncultured Nevskia sp. TaxID=228950 RepID=UPI0025DD7D8A|nr:mechanosensitive ion channel domain-containing protein [uncultured Nevskia sp.]